MKTRRSMQNELDYENMKTRRSQDNELDIENNLDYA